VSVLVVRDRPLENVDL